MAIQNLNQLANLAYTVGQVLRRAKAGSLPIINHQSASLSLICPFPLLFHETPSELPAEQAMANQPALIKS